MQPCGGGVKAPVRWLPAERAAREILFARRGQPRLVTRLVTRLVGRHDEAGGCGPGGARFRHLGTCVRCDQDRAGKLFTAPTDRAQVSDRLPAGAPSASAADTLALADPDRLDAVHRAVP